MSTVVEVPLRWRPSRLARRLTLLAVAALAVAVLAHRPELVAFAAPLLGALATGAVRRPPERCDVEFEPGTAGCFEGETVLVTVRAMACAGCDELELRLAIPQNVELVDHKTRYLRHGVSAEWTLRTPRWGRFRPTAQIIARASAGLLVAMADVATSQVRTYPRPAPEATPLRSTDLPDRIGAHIARRRGEGVEFAGIRPYIPGDHLRTVNWSASARRGRLHVTERLTERAADVVTLIDTYAVHTGLGPAPVPAAAEALDLAVHGAAQTVQGALRRGDRAGVVALGGQLRWLSPNIGRTQFYRVVDAVLDACPVPGDPVLDHPGHTDLVPSGVLSAGAIVVAFTPLLDGRIVLSLNDIRLRGYAVIVIDVLRDIPRVAARPIDPLVARMWRLERASMHRNFATLGIPVLPWRADAALDEVLGPVGRRPLAARRAPR
ncbi:MAG: DUF58 domain-containing protein [Haloechinothrix sp.]